MRTKYGIGIFILAFVLIYLTTGNMYTESSEVKQPEASVSADGQAFDSSGYYLYEVNGYIVVYRNDKRTVYEYTDIIYDELPQLIQKEIKNGKYVEDIDELYGFLENYTS